MYRVLFVRSYAFTPGKNVMRCVFYSLLQTHRLEITVYDILLVEQTQTFDNRITEAPYQAHAETIVIVLLYQLVQIETANRRK